MVKLLFQKPKPSHKKKQSKYEAANKRTVLTSATLTNPYVMVSSYLSILRISAQKDKKNRRVSDKCPPKGPMFI